MYVELVILPGDREQSLLLCDIDVNRSSSQDYILLLIFI